MFMGKMGQSNQIYSQIGENNKISPNISSSGFVIKAIIAKYWVISDLYTVCRVFRAAKWLVHG